MLLDYMRRAVALNASGTRVTAAKRAVRVKALPMPPAFAAAQFRKFTPGKRRDYIEWIVDAKQEATRTRRIATALERIAEGKIRNWKYLKC